MDRPAPTAPKAEWRRWARTLPPVPTEVAAAVARGLRAFVAGIDGPVLAYVALPDEVALDGVSADVLCLPRLGGDGALTVHLDEGPRERHDLGIDQPPAGLPVVDPSELAAVLVPGRVFDRAGFRLGRGGGHYDRLLPAVAPGVPIVGVTVEVRLVDELPRERHDVPMTHLATEAGVTSTK